MVTPGTYGTGATTPPQRSSKLDAPSFEAATADRVVQILDAELSRP
jgi:hypothetical protein